MTDDTHKKSAKTEAEPIPVNGNGGQLADGLEPSAELLAVATGVAPGADAAVSGNGAGTIRKTEAERAAPGKKADEDPVGKVYDSVLIKRLGHYVKPYWVQAVISSISVMLKSLSDVTGPYLLKVAIDRYLVKDPGAGL